MVWPIGNSAQEIALNELIQHQSSDRVLAIVGGAILEDGLQNAIKSRLRPPKSGVTGGSSSRGGTTPRPDIRDRLFRSDGPLGSFAPKIDLGYLLYMFDEQTRNAMHGIVRIRNLFAHQLDITFSSSGKMTAAVQTLTLHEGRTHYPNLFIDQNSVYEIEPIDTNRGKFIVNLQLCLFILMADHQKHLHGKNDPYPNVTGSSWVPLGA
jgi:hypothetical protein